MVKLAFSAKPYLKDLNFRSLSTLLATWFGCGLIRPGPGTWGTIGGLPFAVFFYIIGGPGLLLIAALAIIPVGLWATKKFEEATKTSDADEIVIDEVAGVWIALLPAGLNPFLFVAAVILFRVFDIWKPWPIGWADENIKGKWGVMLDDIIAGVITAILLFIIGDYVKPGL